VATFYCGGTRYTSFDERVLNIYIAQIEYMVVAFNDLEKTAKLSLRQTEILAKLAAIVEDICVDCPPSCAALFCGLECT
jgi:hypothetical protein